jgi:hypothetical protein
MASLRRCGEIAFCSESDVGKVGQAHAGEWDNAGQAFKQANKEAIARERLLVC